MFPASAKGGGLSLSFPDVCKTPTPVAGSAPMPYPNIATTAKAAQQSKVKIANKTTAVKSTRMSRSQGDEAGTMKGMVSSTNKTKAKVEVDKIKALLNQHHSKLMAMNSKDPDEWQHALGEYMVTVGALYVTKHNAS